VSAHDVDAGRIIGAGAMGPGAATPITRSQHMNTLARFGILATLALAAGGALAASATGTTEVEARWQTRKLELEYFGLTARYSCDGIEDKVRAFLRAFGARKDMHVRAYGCDMGTVRVSRHASVKGEFQVLVPTDDAAATDAVASRWQPLDLRANRPFEMGEGDCELFEQLRPTLEKAFTQRGATYHVSCTPYQVGMGSWSLKAEVLRPVQP
jgi:hypothetical protein